MGVHLSEIDRRMESFETACRSAGLKLTHQRMEIFREVAQTEEHPPAETIYDRVRKRVPSISLDTVYRTLITLEKLGVISRVNVLCERTRFDANMSPHHHVVCTSCGMVRDFSSPAADALPIPEEVKSWGEVTSIHVELRTVCSDCSARKRATA
jgi:Fur family transcriptional regulator, peroxide stress response regulator